MSQFTLYVTLLQNVEIPQYTERVPAQAVQPNNASGSSFAQYIVSSTVMNRIILWHIFCNIGIFIVLTAKRRGFEFATRHNHREYISHSARTSALLLYLISLNCMLFYDSLRKRRSHYRLDIYMWITSELTASDSTLVLVVNVNGVPQL